ncbi:hypothetical protein J3456_15805 [Sulfitobacter sp. NFXS29]
MDNYEIEARNYAISKLELHNLLKKNINILILEVNPDEITASHKSFRSIGSEALPMSGCCTRWFRRFALSDVGDTKARGGVTDRGLQMRCATPKTPPVNLTSACSWGHRFDAHPPE